MMKRRTIWDKWQVIVKVCDTNWMYQKKKKNKRLHIFVKGLAILFGLQKEI